MTRVITHYRPHLDELFAMWLVRVFGAEQFGDVDWEHVDFWGTGGETPDGRSPEEWEEDGFILIGLGQGRFDEHTQETKGERRCASDLVAEFLGVDDDQRLERVREYVRQADSTNQGGQYDDFGLANLVKAMYMSVPADAVIHWAFLALDAIFAKQAQFYAAKEDVAGGTTHELTIPGENRPVVMLVVTSDNEQAAAFARSQFAGNHRARIVVQRNSAGQTQVFGAKGQDLGEVAMVLRYLEAEARGHDIRFLKPWEVTGIGMLEHWYLPDFRNMVLNGSTTAVDGEPSKLDLDAIAEAIRTVLEGNFHPDYADECKQGNCAKSRCPWYRFTLKRCSDVRRGSQR